MPRLLNRCRSSLNCTLKNLSEVRREGEREGRSFSASTQSHMLGDTVTGWSEGEDQCTSWHSFVHCTAEVKSLHSWGGNGAKWSSVLNGSRDVLWSWQRVQHPRRNLGVSTCTFSGRRSVWFAQSYSALSPEGGAIRGHSTHLHLQIGITLCSVKNGSCSLFCSLFSLFSNPCTVLSCICCLLSVYVVHGWTYGPKGVYSSGGTWWKLHLGILKLGVE